MMNCRIYFAANLLAVLTFSASTTSVAAQMTKSSPSYSVISQTSPASTKPIVVTELVEQLRTADVEERRKIIQQLSDSQQNIVPELVQALSDPDTLVKSGVAEVLGNLADASVPAIPALIEMMSSTQRAIVPSMGLSGGLSTGLPSLPLPPRIPIFSPSSSTQERRSPPNPPENPESLLRITAIAALGKIGLPARTAATQPLTQALQDRDPWVKLNATWALAEIGASTPLLAYWLEAIQNPNPALRRNAAQLFRDNSSLLPKVFGSEADASTTVVLLAVLKDEDEYIRDTASRALELLGTKALPGLVQALKAPEPIVRLEAAQRLGNMGGSAQSAVPNLLELLQDNGRYVPPPRKPGELFLTPLPAIPYFRENPPAPDNPEKLVRVNAAIALGRLGDRKTIPALKNGLKDNNPWMQLATAWALFRLGQNQGLPVVGRLIQHPNVSIQYQALTQLRRYGSQSASYLLPYYKARLDSKSDDERNNAIIGIGDMGVAALDLVPKLRTILTGNRKHSPAYAATVLGQIARDTATAWQNGNLSSQQRQQAIAEFTKVLQIIQAPNALFNREPGNRVSNALNILRNGR
jgi:HEAT repeat protein